MQDGVRLSARIWLPEDAEHDPVPAILEYIPYRKNDATAVRDAGIHPYFAGHGYASVRVDLRGSGDSEGILLDEYLPQEQEDGIEVIRWLAAQQWCTGAVGMIGKSWGGFNGLQVAAHAPDELKAVVSVCSTDDRYADDVHYIGGCVFGAYMLSWAPTMLAYNARPPDPRVVGDRWRTRWLERLEQTPPFIDAWLSHQRRDDFWKQGSVCEDYETIRCAVYMVGGWADGYPNAILRFLAGYPGPRKGLIGPWAHLYPHDGIPGPAIGFLQECLRWFDHWLKGLETGIMDEPLLRVWMHDSVPPSASYVERPGRWVAEPLWPSQHMTQRRLVLNAAGLEDEPAEQIALVHRGTLAHGIDSGTWVAWGEPGDHAPDQQAEDGRSLCFTSAPLSERLELLGSPEVSITIISDRPLALLAVRLCDVAPTGASALVTRGLLNLTHRQGHGSPERLVPGEPMAVTVRLRSMAYAFPAGHRIRLALSATYWPWAWPSPEPVTLTFLTGGASELVLPVRPPRADDAALRPFDVPEGPPPLEIEIVEPSQTGRRISYDVVAGRWKLVADLSYFGSFRIAESGLEYRERGRDTFTIVEREPLAAEAGSSWSIAIGRGGWQTRVETESRMTGDSDAFRVTNALEAYEGNTRVFAKAWQFSVPRDLV
jgi:putative CocE/NonD family hydrolase